MSNTPTNKLAPLRAKWNAAAERNLPQMAERRWLYTFLYVFSFLVLTFILYSQWNMGYLTWHRLITERSSQLFVCGYLLSLVMYPRQIYRIWATWNRMQAAKQREWEAAHPIPTEGVWPPPPMQP